MKQKLDFIQIARGIAALLVVLHHIGGSCLFYYNYTILGGVFEPGWSAVDFFFVLSGFIIYYIHGKELGNLMKLRNYLIKRFIRIYPIYWVIALVSLFLIIFFQGQVTKSTLVQMPLDYVVKSFLLINQNKEPFLGVAWSLCYEVFFYFIFGLGIAFGRRFLFAIFIFYVIGMFYSVYFPSSGKNQLFDFLTSNYDILFIIGIFVAWGSTLINDTYILKYTTQLYSLFIISILLFIISWILVLYNPIVFDKSAYYSRLTFGFSSGLIILVISKLKFTSHNLFIKFLLLIGDASYVLYLSHVIVLAVIFKLITKINFGNILPPHIIYYTVSLMALILCTISAIIIHKMIEKKIILWLGNTFIRK